MRRQTAALTCRAAASISHAAPSAEYFDTRATKRRLVDYIARGQVLVGCEGEDVSMPYVLERAGLAACAYSSDYPHEVDLVDAKRQIAETVERDDLSAEAKRAVLGENARRFFRL